MTTDMHDFEQPWERKVWGEVQHVFNSPDVAVSVLKVKAGFRCSRHLHEHRCNQFILVSGKIEVWSWLSNIAMLEYPNHPSWKDVMSLDSEYRSTKICSCIPHMFVVIEDGIVVEIYTPDGGPVDANDIVRFDEGGPV